MKKLRVNLFGKGKGMSIDDAIRELENYKKELNRKTIEFKRRLIEVGIDTAKANSGEYEGYIVFKPMHLDEDPSYLVAVDGKKIIREWWYKGGIKTAEVSPLLMAEFGSGWLAQVIDNVEGVGQGTFPRQKHAFDEDGWYWTTPDGITHHSRGEAPTFPMHNACLKMLEEADRIAKEVFGNG